MSNIRELMRPEMREVVGEGKPAIYEPPDVFNPDLHPPPGEIDVLSIVEAGVDFQPILAPDYTGWYKKPKFDGPPKVSIGKGATLFTATGDMRCDGSVDSWCNKGEDQKCLLYSHNDGRHGISFDGVSGWTVMNIPDLKNGIIAIKIESWHQPSEMTKTDGWKTINNERRRLGSSLSYHNSTDRIISSSNYTTPSLLAAGRRALKAKPTEMCDDFKFEFAIDGKVTAWNKTEFESNNHHVERVVEIFTLLNQPDYTGGVEKEVEVAVQIRGCPREGGKVHKLSHIYWS